MRRTLVLVALVVVAGLLVVRTPPPRRRSGPESVRGPSVLRLEARDVTSVSATIGERRFAAVRDGARWRVQGVSPTPALDEALDAFVGALVALRAVHAFRTDDLAQFGLDAPGATIVLDGGRGRRTLLLGRFDSAGSALYARREGTPRVFLVGAAVGSAAERVLYQVEQARKRAAGA